MNLNDAAAFYKLRLLNYDKLKHASSEWLDELPYSDDLFEVYSDPSFFDDTSATFEKLLMERNIPIPTEKEAVYTAIRFYLRLISERKCDPYEGMAFIDQNLRGHGEDDNAYVGDAFGLEHMYTWYRELQDAEDGSELFYYTDLPKEEAIIRFKEHLVEEANKLLEKK